MFDLWIEWWRKHRCRGDVIVVRYADDFVIGFRDTAARHKRVWRNSATRFAKFGLKLHAEKTRLIEFGRYAAERRKRRGEGRPETFDFLGFTHMCAKTRKHGRFTVHRYSSWPNACGRRSIRSSENCVSGCTARWAKRDVGCGRLFKAG